jgi:hypothetical protein
MYVPGDSQLREALATFVDRLGDNWPVVASMCQRRIAYSRSRHDGDQRQRQSCRPGSSRKPVARLFVSRDRPDDDARYGPGPTPTASCFRMSIAFSLLAPLWPSRTRWR